METPKQISSILDVKPSRPLDKAVAVELLLEDKPLSTLLDLTNENAEEKEEKKD